MIKIIHAADFHLDSAFSSCTAEQAVLRRQEQRLALQSFAKLCCGCDIVLLAGDLFDSARIYRDTLDALKECFASIGAKIFISPGNHDFVAAGSPYLSENWGENVHIFTKPQIECVHLPELNCDVYGAGFVSQDQLPMLQNFRVQNDSAINLMVMHGDLQPNSPYNPIRVEEIHGVDYLALGHVHSKSASTIGTMTFAYPGCLMGRGFDECGQKGILRVTAQKHRCDLEFLPVYTRKYEILSVDVNALSSLTLPNNCINDCYRIILTGESSGINVGALEESLRKHFFSLQIRDMTLPKQELWSALGEDTLRGHCLRELKAQYDSSDEKQRIAKAAKLLLALMDGREVSL